ncbi:MAG: hypothetical protein EOM36_03155 [Bacteroidia bacterium]|nr:hypothetical protein [Bacteroidia bacterium]
MNPIFRPYQVNEKRFRTLSEAKRYANDNEASIIYLVHGIKRTPLFQYHPMSERIERICTVKDAVKALKGVNMKRNCFKKD